MPNLTLTLEKYLEQYITALFLCLGFVFVADIPRGVVKVEVSEYAPSINTIALTDEDGNFCLNDNKYDSIIILYINRKRIDYVHFLSNNLQEIYVI